MKCSDWLAFDFNKGKGEPVAKEKAVYVGKAKELYETERAEELRLLYLDQATALNGLRKDEIVGKGQLNNQITSLIFTYLTNQGINNHFIRELSKNEQLVKRVRMLPLEVVIRNVATGSFVKKFHAEEGKVFSQPVLEFYYKNDALADPMMNDEQVLALDLATTTEINEIKTAALNLNKALQELFLAINLTLVDFKVEYGLTAENKIILADEITPDTCRLWDVTTGESLDKDIYRQERGDLVSVYTEVYQRLENYLKK